MPKYPPLALPDTAPARRRHLGPLSRLGALGLMASAVGCGSGGGTVPAPPPPAATVPALAVPEGYRLVWADEFDQAGLPDASRWVHDTGMNKTGWHNREKQYYGGPRLENAAVQDGRLVITARREDLSAQPDWGGQAYSSARLITAGKRDWTYGFFEVRAKLPCGGGTWPAIWMLGSEGGWPAGGELDILEQVGNNPTRVFSTVHTTAGSGGNGQGAATTLADPCTAFHNYQMHWTAQEIRFGIDGVVHYTYRNPGTGTAAWPFDKPQFLILNVAIGGDLGGAVDDGIFPVSMQVEYARVFQKAP
jgi:beta-glucanase (GH16 family)